MTLGFYIESVPNSAFSRLRTLEFLQYYCEIPQAEGAVMLSNLISGPVFARSSFIKQQDIDDAPFTGSLATVDDKAVLVVNRKIYRLELSQLLSSEENFTSLYLSGRAFIEIAPELASFYRTFEDQGLIEIVSGIGGSFDASFGNSFDNETL